MPLLFENEIDLKPTSGGGGGSDAIINQNADGISPLYVWNGTEEEWNNGEASGFYNWTSGESSIGEVVGITFYRGNLVSGFTYGNGMFVACGNAYGFYSSNGINWNKTSYYGNVLAYGNDKFVKLTDTTYAYSTDGVNWTQGTLPVSGGWKSIAYGDGKFVAISFSGSKSVVSTDGINWVGGTLPGVGNNNYRWCGVTYGNGMFVATGNYDAYSRFAFAYSTDGINWTEGKYPSISYIGKVTYGNGKFVAISSSGSSNNYYIYSNDGINWAERTFPVSGYWEYITFGTGLFVVANYNGSIILYSSDGINWTEKQSINLSSSQALITYGNDKLVIVGSNSDLTQNQAAYIPVTAALSAFTDTETPDTSSTVYSAPSVESSLTITETGTNTITLSDGNVYNRNQAGDVVVIQSIGEAHPDYISFIDGVGVRIGTTDIADM